MIFSNTTISDIALQVGYGDLQSFRKAFKKKFGISPSVARNQKEDLIFPVNISLELTEINVDIVYLEEENCYYTSINTLYDNMEN